MTNTAIQETPQWEAIVRQVDTGDRVLGGADGAVNIAYRQLANRTVWLKQELESTQQSQKNRQITAGAGLSGGGTLSADRSIALPTPSTLSGSTSNWVGNGTVGHTHELAKATAILAGVVKLVNTLNSTATDDALSAAQGKALNDSKLGNSGSQTLNGTLTVQAANAQYAGIHINNTDAGALGSFLGLDVGGLMRGGVEVFGEGEGSYSVALTATAKGDGSDRHERVFSAATGYVWTRAYGHLHDYFARKTDLTNQINNLRNEINNKFTHFNYPNHYAGAEVWRMPNGLKITTMRIDGINASGEYYLPEAYQGRAIAVANDVGDGRRIVSSYLHPNSNRVTVFVSNLNVSVNIIVIGWANH